MVDITQTIALLQTVIGPERVTALPKSGLGCNRHPIRFKNACCPTIWLTCKTK
jgi:hypothetical protein